MTPFGRMPSYSKPMVDTVERPHLASADSQGATSSDTVCTVKSELLQHWRPSICPTGRLWTASVTPLLLEQFLHEVRRPFTLASFDDFLEEFRHCLSLAGAGDSTHTDPIA